MAVERLLFRAGRQGYTYPEILEVRRGSLRILVPSAESIRRVRITSTLVSLAYIFIGGSLWGAVALRLMPNVGGVAVGVAAVVVFFLGFFGVLVWWDRWSLPLLAEAPRRIVPLELIDTQSYRTFQEIRARAEGTEVRVAIPGSRSRLGEAMGFAGISTISS